MSRSNLMNAGSALLEPYRSASRWIPNAINPFVRVRDILRIGVWLRMGPNNDIEMGARMENQDA